MMNNNKFAHLHIHNEYSQLDGLGTAENYAVAAEELGYEYMALTNHGNIDGIVKWQKACKDHNIKSVLGCEFYMVPDMAVKEKKEKRFHMTVLAKNEQGLESIMRMLTAANERGHFYRPRIDWAVLAEELDNIVIMSACTSTWLYMDPKDVEPLIECMEDDLYLEIMPHIFDHQYTTNDLVLDYHERFGTKIVATNDCHYPTESGSVTQEVLLAMQRKVKWNDPKRWKFDITGLHLRSADEMIDAFKEQKNLDRGTVHKAMLNTIEVAEKCHFILGQKKVYLPKVPGYEKRDESKFLWQLIQAGFERRLPQEQDSDVHKDRLEEEYGLICELGFQRYFLIVWELISWCKKNDIMTGPGRGSVGGSLVAFCMGITDVDPIKYGLVFARFISPARIDLPDIDMDFEDVKRYRIREHLEDLYGKDHVTSLSTFLTMKGRLAVRDVSRVFDVPRKDVDKASKSIVVRSGGDFRSDFTIEDAFNTFEDGIKFKKDYPEVAQISMDLEGQVKGSGKHAAAMCISSDNLKDGLRTNLANRKDELMSNWDKYDAEFMGIMKLDVLGLKALTILSRAKDMVKANHGVDIVYDQLPLDDKDALAMTNKGLTVGAFQIGSVGLTQYCRELGIDCFEDIVHATALWRPGTLRTGMTVDFVARKHGTKPVEYIHPILEEKTKETFGIILYQEQVMWLMYELAGLGWKTCDTVRKVISKSQGDAQFASFKQQFMDGCEERGTLSNEDAATLWDGLSSFGSYSFNKAHAVEYSLITYWDMYMKTHYPKEFMAASLTSCGDEKKQSLIEETRRLGIDVAPPKVSYSHATQWMVDKHKEIVYCPFLEIRGIGEKTAEQIQYLGKDGFYTGEGRKPNKTAMETLTKLKAFSAELITEEEEEDMNQMFSFDLSKDPMYKFRKLWKRLEDKITLVGDIDFTKPDDEVLLLLGKMIEVRYGYRKNLEKVKSGQSSGIAGTVDMLGGAYGSIKDDTKACMLVFGGGVYTAKKDKVEHCDQNWMLAKVDHPEPTNTVFAHNVWIEEDLNTCDLAGLNIPLTEPIKYRNRAIIKCKDCELCDEGRKPVTNSMGGTNILLVGEAPGKDEDREGIGFTGRVGNQLWKALAVDDLHRDDFHISTVVKCFPKKSKQVKKSHISACRRHLELEIKKINPPLILAFGNTCLKFFKGQDSGIMDLSGTTEWNNRYGCWIHWCISPASTLYDNSNDDLFEQSIASFVDKVAHITDLFSD
jgi:DNA polymerase III subunit alpha